MEILIGLDNHYLLKPLELAGGEREEPYGVRTPLGWTIMGPVTRSGTANASTCCTVEEPDREIVEEFATVLGAGIVRPLRLCQTDVGRG